MPLWRAGKASYNDFGRLWSFYYPIIKRTLSSASLLALFNDCCANQGVKLFLNKLTWAQDQSSPEARGEATSTKEKIPEARPWAVLLLKTPGWAQRWAPRLESIIITYPAFTYIFNFQVHVHNTAPQTTGLRGGKSQDVWAILWVSFSGTRTLEQPSLVCLDLDRQFSSILPNSASCLLKYHLIEVGLRNNIIPVVKICGKWKFKMKTNKPTQEQKTHPGLATLFISICQIYSSNICLEVIWPHFAVNFLSNKANQLTLTLKVHLWNKGVDK